MSDLEQSLEDLILRARNGDEAALGELCDRHRPYLRLMAQRNLDSRIKVRADESDLVQQSLLSAVQNFQKFRGTKPGHFAAWLQAILERNAIDVVRAQRADKRNIHREEPGIEEYGPSNPCGDSPSVRVMRSEEAVQLAMAMESLPEDQREAVRLRHLEGWPLRNIAHSMDRSEEAAAGLIKRGMAGLRKHVRANTGD